MIYTARAFAKTNLFLDIVAKRPDGYHDINTVMQSLSLYDEVSLELVGSGIAVSCNDKALAGDSNIAYLACKSFFEYTEIDCGARLFITKNIPVAAGLGGGSSDAAAVLMLLNEATKADLSTEELIPIAAKLGADVPFFLVGGTVKAQGIGERLTKIRDACVNMVLFKTHFKQSTGAMYNLLDERENARHGDIDTFISKLASDDPVLFSSGIFNSFEACWDMEKLSAPIAPLSPLKVFLSGSGPTVCALFSDTASAENAESYLKAAGIEAFAVSSVPQGVLFV